MARFVADEKPARIGHIDGIIRGVLVEIGLPTAEAERIAREKAAKGRVVLAGAEVNEVRVGVVEAAGEGEGLEAGVGVCGDVAEFVVGEVFDGGASGDVDDRAGAAEVVGDDAVGGARADDQRRDVGAFGVGALCYPPGYRTGS